MLIKQNWQVTVFQLMRTNPYKNNFYFYSCSSQLQDQKILNTLCSICHLFVAVHYSVTFLQENSLVQQYDLKFKLKLRQNKQKAERMRNKRKKHSGRFLRDKCSGMIQGTTLGFQPQITTLYEDKAVNDAAVFCTVLALHLCVPVKTLYLKILASFWIILLPSLISIHEGAEFAANIDRFLYLFPKPAAGSL